jgi:hypothetical protein
LPAVFQSPVRIVTRLGSGVDDALREFADLQEEPDQEKRPLCQEGASEEGSGP